MKIKLNTSGCKTNSNWAKYFSFQKLFLQVLLSFSFPLLLNGQDNKLLKKGDNFFNESQYVSALPFYEQALEGNKQSPYVNLRIAQCHLRSFSKTKALPFAVAAATNEEKPTSEIYFTLATAYHMNHDFDKAKENYLKSDPGNRNKRLISKLIQECDFGKQYVTSPVNVKITNAGETVNSPYQEYLPHIQADLSRLVYTSRRPGSTGGKKERDGMHFEDIYICQNKGGAWEKPLQMKTPINSEIHDACIGLSPDGQTMFIYKGSNGGDIYTSRLKGGHWTKPVPMPVNTEFMETSACLSPDERTLYFVRGIMGGQRDIYMCSRTVGGQWSKPKKVDGINTEYDEDAPFLHPDGKTLYFSSKGHSSMGGYDVFKCTKEGSGWSKPENLGYPINTASDDVYFVLGADGKIAFYSSGKEGGFGQQDIYSIRMPVAEHQPELALLKGTIKDAHNRPVEADITVTDNSTREIVAQFSSNSESGEYLVALPSGKNYGVTIEKEGSLFYSDNVFLDSKEGFKEIKKNVQLQSAKTGSTVVLRNIFFDTGKSELRSESSIELERLVKILKQNPSIKIEIAGHTDNIGDESKNIILSEERAQGVAEYLVGKGIKHDRVQAKGYGSSQPVTSNTTEEGRQQNRRTEFKIL